MTREELRGHCERQIQQFERVEKIKPVTPNDWKRYEEHKLILELLEQTDGDLISRQAVLDRWDKMSVRGRMEFDQEIMMLPSAEKTAEWIKQQSGDELFPEEIVCSKCYCSNSHLDFDKHNNPIGKVFFTSKYCPNCGCRMDGGKPE